MFKIVLASCLVALCCACGSPSQICSAEARDSVVVTVLDPDGNPVADADVQYSVDGGAPEDCFAINDTYSCGREERGDFVITATQGALTATESLTVGDTADGCHVDTQEVTLELAP